MHCGYCQVLTWVFTIELTQYFYNHYHIKSSQTLCEEGIVIFTPKVKKPRVGTVTRLTRGRAASKCQKGIKTQSPVIFLKSRESPGSCSTSVGSTMCWTVDLMSESPFVFSTRVGRHDVSPGFPQTKQMGFIFRYSVESVDSKHLTCGVDEHIE